MNGLCCIVQVQELIVDYTTDKCLNRAAPNTTCADYIQDRAFEQPVCYCDVPFELKQDFVVSFDLL